MLYYYFHNLPTNANFPKLSQMMELFRALDLIQGIYLTISSAKPRKEMDGDDEHLKYIAKKNIYFTSSSSKFSI